MEETPEKIIEIAKAYKTGVCCFWGFFGGPWFWIITIPLLIRSSYRLGKLLDDSINLFRVIWWPITGILILMPEAKDILEKQGFRVGLLGPNIREIEEYYSTKK